LKRLEIFADLSSATFNITGDSDMQRLIARSC
jgi:hypothetical protein